ncbi:hypothetical protein [Novosphingobium sp. B 225]|uniref:hypothetical protein n=1 Tax=Novosphingobium sp. B 225 TaxID=1961849 RepID=UPI000B4AC171|nr:hypothetical protein [Novosphingobium sp. B 225]
MNKGNRLWQFAGVIFIFVLLIAIGFTRIGGIGACANTPDPILAFELAKSPAELAALFPESCRAAALAAQRTGLWLDILAFIPVYGGALIYVLRAASGGDPALGLLVRGAIVLVVTGMLFDLWENSRMLQLIGTFPGDQATFDQLVAAPRIKFALLAVAEAAAGWLCWRSSNWTRWLGVAAIGGAVLTLAGLLIDPHWIGLGGLLAFLSLAVVSWVRALRPEAG